MAEINLGNADTMQTSVYDINYIPDYVKAEQERRANEAIRIENENERIALAEDLEYKRDTDYWKGDKGDKGDPAIGLIANLTYNGSTPVLDKTFAEILEVLENNQDARVYDSDDYGYMYPHYFDDEVVVFKGTSGPMNIVFLSIDDSNTVTIQNTYYSPTTVVRATSTDGEIPTAKAVYNALPGIASNSKAGIIKTYANYGTQMDYEYLKGVVNTAAQYNSASNEMFVSKGTLENVLTAKGYETESAAKNDYAHTLTLSQNLTTGDLTVGISNYNGTTLDYGTVEGIATRDYVDDLVGDIGTALDLINGEVI